MRDRNLVVAARSEAYMPASKRVRDGLAFTARGRPEGVSVVVGITPIAQGLNPLDHLHHASADARASDQNAGSMLAAGE